MSPDEAVNLPATPSEIGLSTGETGWDYARALSQENPDIGRGRRRRIGNTSTDVLADRYPALATVFTANANTYAMARNIQDDRGSENLALALRSPHADPAAAEDLAARLPGLDTTLRHIRRGGLMFRGIPLPGGEVGVDELRPLYEGPEQVDILHSLQEKRAQLERQYPDLADAEGAELPNGITPSMKAVYDGIVTAVDDVISPDRQSLGYDLGSFNIGDVADKGRAIIRGSTMVMDSLGQYGQASFRRMVEDPGEYFSLSNNAFTQEGNERAAEPFFDETDLGISLVRLRNGLHVDTGSGFFINPTSGVAQTRLTNEQTHGLIDGHVITMGRWAADSAGLEPDSLPFDVLSGAVDLGWLLVEPGGALVDAATRSNLVRRELARAGGYTHTRSIDLGHADEFIRDGQGARVIEFAAGVDQTDDLAVLRARESLNTRVGSGMPDWAQDALLRSENEGDAESLLRGFMGMGMEAPGVPLGRVGTLGKAGDIMLAPAVSWRRKLARSRLAQETPATGAEALDNYNVDSFAQELTNSLRNARVDEDTIATLVGRVFRDGFENPSRVRYQQLERELAELEQNGVNPADSYTTLPGQADEGLTRYMEIEDELEELHPGLFISRPTPRKGVLYEVWSDAQDAKRERLMAAGIDEGNAEALAHLHEVGRRVDTNIIQDVQATGAYWTRLVADDDPKLGAVNRMLFPVIDGEGIVDLSAPGFAQMAAEHLGRYLPLEDDYRQIARLTRSVPNQILTSWLSANQRLWHNADDVSGQLFQPWRGLDEWFMNKVWKPSRLLRPAFPIRVVGEEQFRIAAAGMDTALGHPLSYLSLIMGTRREGKLHNFLDAATFGRADDIGTMVADEAGIPWEAIAEFKDTMNRGSRAAMIPFGGGSAGRFEPHFFYRNADGSLAPGYAAGMDRPSRPLPFRRHRAPACPSRAGNGLPIQRH